MHSVQGKWKRHVYEEHGFHPCQTIICSEYLKNWCSNVSGMTMPQDAADTAQKLPSMNIKMVLDSPVRTLTAEIQETVTELFDKEDASGEKESAANVAKEMRTVRKDGKPMFSPQEWLKPSPISSFFSRLALNKRRGNENHSELNYDRPLNHRRTMYIQEHICIYEVTRGLSLLFVGFFFFSSCFCDLCNHKFGKNCTRRRNMELEITNYSKNIACCTFTWKRPDIIIAQHIEIKHLDYLHVAANLDYR